MTPTPLMYLTTGNSVGQLQGVSSLPHFKERGYSKRTPNCQKCGQHGRKARLKGHKRVCPFKNCECPKCQVVSERQKLMANQIKQRRRQRKESMMSLSSGRSDSSGSNSPNQLDLSAYLGPQQSLTAAAPQVAATAPISLSSTDLSMLIPCLLAQQPLVSTTAALAEPPVTALPQGAAAPALPFSTVTSSLLDNTGAAAALPPQSSPLLIDPALGLSSIVAPQAPTATTSLLTANTLLPTVSTNLATGAALTNAQPAAILNSGVTQVTSTLPSQTMTAAPAADLTKSATATLLKSASTEQLIALLELLGQQRLLNALANTSKPEQQPITNATASYAAGARPPMAEPLNCAAMASLLSKMTSLQHSDIEPDSAAPFGLRAASPTRRTNSFVDVCSI